MSNRCQRSALLRAILRSPRFRNLETAWRALDLLVRRVEEETIRISFLDASREAYVFAGDSPNDSPMFGFFPNGVGIANVRDFAGVMAG